MKKHWCPTAPQTLLSRLLTLIQTKHSFTMKPNHAFINRSSCIMSGFLSNMKAYRYDTVCQKAYSPLPPGLSMLSTWQLRFPDESCPPMRCARHSNRPGGPFLRTAIHLATNLTAAGFRFCASSPSR